MKWHSAQATATRALRLEDVHLVPFARVEHTTAAPTGERHAVAREARPHQIAGGVFVFVAEVLGADQERRQPVGVHRIAASRHGLTVGQPHQHRPVAVHQRAQLAAGDLRALLGPCGHDGLRRAQRRHAALRPTGRHRTHIFHGNPVDLTNLGHQQIHQVRRGQGDGEFVDGAAATAFEDVDTHHVALHGADATGHMPQRTRTVGQPYTNDEGLHADDGTDALRSTHHHFVTAV